MAEFVSNKYIDVEPIKGLCAIFLLVERERDQRDQPTFDFRLILIDFGWHSLQRVGNIGVC